MKQWFFLIGLLLLLTACSNETYTKIAKDQPFIATANIKDGTFSFVDNEYNVIANWEIKKPFSGGLLLEDRDTLLIYGKEMNTVELFSLEEGKQIDSWDVEKGIVNLLSLWKTGTMVAVNQSLNEILFLNMDGEVEDRVKVGKSPLTVLQNDHELYVVNFADTKLSVINLNTRAVDREFPISSTSTGALLRQEADEIWLGGHGEGEKIEEKVHIYSTKTGKLKKMIDVPFMPINVMEKDGFIYILSHGSNALYKVNSDYEIIDKTSIGMNPFEMKSFQNDTIIAGYDSNELYVMNTDELTVTKTVKVGKGPFQMIIRE